MVGKIRHLAATEFHALQLYSVQLIATQELLVAHHTSNTYRLNGSYYLAMVSGTSSPFCCQNDDFVILWKMA